jgi:hypothetical protein
VRHAAAQAAHCTIPTTIAEPATGGGHVYERQLDAVGLTERAGTATPVGAFRISITECLRQRRPSATSSRFRSVSTPERNARASDFVGKVVSAAMRLPRWK